MRARKVDPTCCENSLEQLLRRLLAVEADDLVGNSVELLQCSNRNEVSVGAVEERASALGLRLTHRGRRPR